VPGAAGLHLRVDEGVEGGADRLAERLPERLGARIGLGGLLEDLDRQARTVEVPDTASATGFTWDERDTADTAWWPQGLTTSYDAAAIPSTAIHPDRRVLISGWYAKRGGRADTATRISVVDLDANAGGPRYRHVLLVEPYRSRWLGVLRHRLVQVHAGGLVWCGDRLLVADTRRGLRVFDLADTIRLTGRLTGRVRGLPAGTTHVVPQSGRWHAGSDEGTRALRWSFISLDRTDAGTTSLIAGEYDKRGAGARVARWVLDPRSGLPEPAAAEVLRTDIRSMQGATRVNGGWVVTASNGPRRRGHLWTSTGGPFRQHAKVLPPGPEDVSWDGDTGRLWTQTEYPGRRYVLSVPLPG
jgi:hypothetical protein